jgi:hypothetical protein
MPGHTVPVHLFTNVNVTAPPSAPNEQIQSNSAHHFQELLQLASHHYCKTQPLYDPRITSQAYAEQSDDHTDSLNPHVLEAMQLCLVVSNGEGKEERYAVSLQHSYPSVLVLLLQLQFSTTVMRDECDSTGRSA